MTRIRILPYKMASKSAKRLSVSLNALRTRSVGLYKPRGKDFIINWGASIIPAFFERVGHLNASGANITFLNHPDRVASAVNKLETFRILHGAGISVPDFTIDPHIAAMWARDAYDIYARTILTGHSGHGIVIFNDNDLIPRAPLYTKAIDNHGEYRVHVVNGEVIVYTKKRRRNGDQPTGEQCEIQNLANGWIYTRENLKRLQRIEDIALRAIAALGLDFGAVDVIKDENGDVFVLEVNTACGMSESTLNAYLSAFRACMQSIPNLITNTHA